MIVSNGGGSAFTLNLYNGASSQPVTWKSADYENSIAAKWVAPVNGRYYLEIKPLHPEMMGTDMRYQVGYGPGSWLHLPVVGR